MAIDESMKDQRIHLEKIPWKTFSLRMRCGMTSRFFGGTSLVAFLLQPRVGL